MSKRLTHSGKGGISRVFGGLTNALTRPHTSSPSIAAAASSLNRNTNGVVNQGSTKFMDIIERSLSTIARSSIPRFPNEVRQWDHFLRDETCFNVLETLAKTPLHSKDDGAVIQALLFLFMENKNYNNRYFQLALERFFQSKQFNLEDALKAVPEEFTLLDIFKVNGNMVHQSTIFTAFQCHKLGNQPGFSDKIESNVIIQTPIKGFYSKNMDKGLHKFIMDCQGATGNTISDIQLNNHPYDFKFSNDNSVPLARNVIVPIQGYNEKGLNSFISGWLAYIGNIEKTIKVFGQILLLIIRIYLIR